MREEMRRTYASLLDIPEPVDLADLFRAAPHCPEHAREVLRMSPRPKIFWMQSGIVSPEAREILAGKGIYCEHTTAANYAAYLEFCRQNGETRDCLITMCGAGLKSDH